MNLALQTLPVGTDGDGGGRPMSGGSTDDDASIGAGAGTGKF